MYSREILEKSQLGITRIIGSLGIKRDKYYNWVQRLGLENNHNGQQPKQHWLTPDEKEAIIDFARKYILSNRYYLADGYRRITYNSIDANVFA